MLSPPCRNIVLAGRLTTSVEAKAGAEAREPEAEELAMAQREERVLWLSSQEATTST
jgi:hypothetical protein